MTTPLTGPPLLDDEPPLQPARNKINAATLKLSVVGLANFVKIFMIFPFKLLINLFCVAYIYWSARQIIPDFW